MKSPKCPVCTSNNTEEISDYSSYEYLELEYECSYCESYFKTKYKLMDIEVIEL